VPESSELPLDVPLLELLVDRPLELPLELLVDVLPELVVVPPLDTPPLELVAPLPEPLSPPELPVEDADPSADPSCTFCVELKLPPQATAVTAVAMPIVQRSFIRTSRDNCTEQVVRFTRDAGRAPLDCRCR
jgi:hypothetical protein